MTRPCINLTGFAAPNGRVYAQLRPSRPIDPGDYGSFKAATVDSKYVRQFRRNLITVDKVPDVIRSLRSHGFEAAPSTDLLDKIQRVSATEWMDRRSIEERINSIEQEFKKRTGNTFFPFQRTGAVWLTSRRGAALFDDMGTGKTIQAITAIPASAPVLIICPVNVKSNWRREFNLWRPSVRTQTFEGRNTFKWPEPGQAVIVNYDILPSIHNEKKCSGLLPAEKCMGCAESLEMVGGQPQIVFNGHARKCKGFKKRLDCPGCALFLQNAPPDTVIIFDEAHRIKTSKANRTKRARAIARAIMSKQGRVWILTGTPLMNEPIELWNVLQAADIANEAFDSFDNFVKVFKGKSLPFGGYEWGLPEDELSADDITERLQRVSLRRKKEDVLPQLPLRRWKYVDVPVDREAIRRCEFFLKGKSIDEVIALVEAEKFSIGQMSMARAALAAAKIPAMLEQIETFEEQNEPLVVFSAHRAPIDTLKKRKGWRVITGDVGHVERDEIIELFQAGKLRGVAGVISACSEGITLTRAMHCLFVDLAWNPAQNAQAEDRLVRIGQTRGTIFHILMAEHALDQRVTDVLHRKTKIIQMSVDRSSVKDDAPADVELEAILKAIQEEVSSGAERHQASTELDKVIIDALHTLVFKSGIENRLAIDLAREESVIGLTPAQWRLAGDLRTKGLTKEDLKKLVPIGSAKPKMKGEKTMASDKRSAPTVANMITAIGKLSEEQRGVMFDFIGDDEIQAVFEDMQGLPDKDWDVLMVKIPETWCTDCGEDLPKVGEHECAMADEGEEAGEDGDDEEDDEHESSDAAATDKD